MAPFPGIVEVYEYMVSCSIGLAPFPGMVEVYMVQYR
jgi:hypothetical protein